MIVLAHIGHWYGVFGFIVPALLVIAWIRFQNRRERRRQEFVEDWVFERHEGEWVMVSMSAVPRSPRERRAAPQRAPSPWLPGSGPASPGSRVTASGIDEEDK
jgi:hypothetical protein